LHSDREPLDTPDRIRRTIGEYNFSAQYQQSPGRVGGAIVGRTAALLIDIAIVAALLGTWLAALAASATLLPQLLATIGSARHLAEAIRVGIGGLIAISLLAAGYRDHPIVGGSGHIRLGDRVRRPNVGARCDLGRVFSDRGRVPDRRIHWRNATVLNEICSTVPFVLVPLSITTDP